MRDLNQLQSVDHQIERFNLTIKVKVHPRDSSMSIHRAERIFLPFEIGRLNTLAGFEF